MRRAGKMLMVALLLASGEAAARTAPPLPAPTEPLEPRQAARSGYAPQGIRLGVLHVYPEGEVGRSFREESFGNLRGVSAQRGWITTAAARVRAHGQSGPWAAEARGEVERASGPAAFVGDGTQGGAAVDLRLGLGRRAVAQVEGEWRRAHEPRTAPVAAGQPAEPVPTQALRASLGLQTEHGTVTADLRAQVSHSSFGDVPRLGLETVPLVASVRNGDRDRTEASLAGEVAWRPGGVSALYLRASAGILDYRMELDDNLHQRDATTRRLMAGVALGRPESWRFFLEAGHMSRMGDDARLEDASAVVVNAGATVAVTPLVTARVLASTALAETTAARASAAVVRSGYVEVEHEALRSLVLLTTAEVTWHDYVGIERNDLAFVYGSGLRWRLGPVLRVEAMVRQEQFEAENVLDSYTATEGTLRLAARF